MSKSLLEVLPKIVADGKKQAAQVLEQLESRHRVTLQTRELVIPAKDTAQADLFRAPHSPNQSISQSVNQSISPLPQIRPIV